MQTPVGAIMKASRLRVIIILLIFEIGRVCMPECGFGMRFPHTHLPNNSHVGILHELCVKIRLALEKINAQFGGFSRSCAQL
jgi:hypothetical protein